MLARSAPVRPAVCRAIVCRSTLRGERLPGRVHPEDLLAADEIGWRHEHLPIKAAGTEQGRIEVLQAVGRAHDHHAIVRGETVQLTSSWLRV